MKTLKTIFLSSLLTSQIALAQATQETFEPTSIETAKQEVHQTQQLAAEQIIPKLSSKSFIKIDEVASFDPTETTLVSRSTYGSPVLWWDFGDGTPPQAGHDPKSIITHKYQNSGRYKVKLTVKQGREMKASITKDIFVFTKKGILISDNIAAIPDVIFQAAEKGIWLKEITFNRNESQFSAEEEFARKIQENLPFIKEAKFLFFHTKSVTGLQSFAQVWKNLSQEHKFDLKEKLWIKFVEGSLKQNSKLVQPLFQILEPSFILLTHLEAFNPIIENTNLEKLENSRITENLKTRAIEYRIIDERSRTFPLFIFSKLTTYFVSHGISQNVVYLLLVVPFLTFVTSFVRQVVGLSTFGVYAPLVLSLSFFVLGIEFGIIVLLITLGVSYMIRVLFEKVDLLYIPRLSLLLSALALSFFLILGLAIYFETSLNLSLAIFPMLVMSTVSEKFLSAQSEEGMKNAIIVAGETLIVSLLGYFIFNAPLFKDAILAFPELILLPILGNIWLGRFTGLRLTEYFKFRSLLQEDSQE